MPEQARPRVRGSSYLPARRADGGVSPPAWARLVRTLASRAAASVGGHGDGTRGRLGDGAQPSPEGEIDGDGVQQDAERDTDSRSDADQRTQAHDGVRFGALEQSLAGSPITPFRSNSPTHRA